MQARPRVRFFVGGREGGGSANSILGLLQGLDRERFDVGVVACGEGPFVERVRAAGYQPEVLHVGWPPALRFNRGVHSTRRWLGYLEIPLWTARAALALARYARRERVALIHTNYRHFHFVSALARLGCKLKCVWHWRGVEGWLTRGASGRLLYWLTRGFVWSLANSQATFESIRPMCRARGGVVYNGLRLPRLEPRGTRLRDLLRLPPAARIIGMVGSLNPIKGHLVLLEAAADVCAHHADVHFVYIGGHNAPMLRPYLAQLEQRRAQLGLAQRVHFLGHRDDAAGLIREFDVKIVCTLPPGEGFGLVIIEAMAQAVPVISTRVGAALEIVTDEVDGLLIPPGDPPALSAALERLLGDEQLRCRLAAAGRRTCEERFDLGHTVRLVESTYTGLLGS
jgi:glycosyltransferase involved in cell wall biosynthesis